MTNAPSQGGSWLLLPMIVVLGCTSLYPTVYAAVISLFDWKWGAEIDFVGLRNYARLLEDAEFWTALGNTITFASAATVLEIALGLGLALAVDRLPLGQGIARTLLLIPLMVSGIVVALMSKVLLDSFLGIGNYLLTKVGLPTSAFFGSPDAAMATLIGVDAWWQTAFGFIIILAGIQSLPKDTIEAARIDGASETQIFFRIKLPLLRLVLLTVLIFRSIDTLKVFDIVFGTTGGGPGTATEMIQTLAYRTSYGALLISKAMTLMVVFAVLIMALAAIWIRLERRAVELHG